MRQLAAKYCSKPAFKKEWKTFLGIAEERSRVMKVEGKATYFTKRINMWADLERVRNTFIAHNFRDKSDGYSNRLVKPYDRELNIPNKFPDYIILCGCIHYIHLILVSEFSHEREALASIIKS